MGKRKATTLQADSEQTRQQSTGDPDETVDHDDLCAICHLLIYRPCITKCSHTLCEQCMAMWADVSITSQMRIVGLDDEPMILLPNDIEVRCPMCRTPTTASGNAHKALELRSKYPQTYDSRQREEQAAAVDDFALSVETLTLYIGNTHSLVRRNDDDDDTRNNHNWSFFVRPSRTDLIEEVQVFLHPTFRNHRIVVQFPPYEIHRLGWGTFTIYVNVILKAGYSWMSSEAEDAPDGGRKGKLPLEWSLNFEGRGSQGRCRLKVKREKEGQELEDEREREGVIRRWRRQREADPDYVAPEE